MQDKLTQSRTRKQWGNVAFLASRMTILAAERVEITERDGLKLTMPKRKEELRTSIPPIPVQRKFH